MFKFQYIFFVDNNKKKQQFKTGLKGDLRPKTHPYFHGIIIMIPWEKSLAQSFLVF